MLPTIEVVEAIISSPAHISQYLSSNAPVIHVCGRRMWVCMCAALGGSDGTAAGTRMQD